MIATNVQFDVFCLNPLRS